MKSKFILKKIIDIKNQIYLYCEQVDEKQIFDLSEYSTLNGICIENFIEIPREVDNLGKIDLKSYVFRLKNRKDLFNFEENTYLLLENPYVFVEQSFIISNIGIIVFVKCYDGELNIGTQLIDLETKDIWKIEKRIFSTSSINTYKLREKRGNQNIFEYSLISKNNIKPREKIFLKIVN